jgi:hypothetical protein
MNSLEASVEAQRHESQVSTDKLPRYTAAPEIPTGSFRPLAKIIQPRPNRQVVCSSQIPNSKVKSVSEELFALRI